MTLLQRIGGNIFAALVISLCTPLAHAQNDNSQLLLDEAKKYAVSMPTGSVPATNVLGISNSDVPRVTNFKSITSQLAQGIGTDGKIKNALGFEVAPYLLINDKIQWETYNKSPITRILSRTTASFAVVPSSDSQTASSAFGAQSIFYSNALGKAHEAWVKCDNKVSVDFQTIADEVKLKFPDALPLGPGITPTIDESKITDEKLLKKYRDIKKKRDDSLQACQDTIDSALQAWNATVVAAGLGWGFYSTDNNAKTLKQTASVYWFTAALGWGDGTSNDNFAGLLTLHARKAADERVTDPTNADNLLSEKSTLYGANLRFGNRKFGLLLEYSYRTGIVSGLADEKLSRGFIGMDAKVADNLYLSWGVGSETGRREGENQKFSLMNVKYAFGNMPVFTKNP